MEEILVIILCLFFNAILSGAEMAFVTVSRPRLRELARSGNKAAQTLLKLRDNPERTLSVIQVGITLVGAVAAAVGGAGADEFISPIFQKKWGLSENTAEFFAIVIVVVPLTYLSVVIGELVPKSLALKNPSGIALMASHWLSLFDRILSPVVSILEYSTRLFLKLFFRKAKKELSPGTPDTVELDQLSHQTRQYVLNLVNIEKKRIRDIMLPWPQVTHVDIGLPIEEVEAVILSSGHTRLPVTNEGRVVGIMNTKELLAFAKSGGTVWGALVRPVVQVQGSDILLRGLRLMQEKRSHLSIVFEQDKLSGIVTMEDILEEIIGDVFDEDDEGTLRRILSTGSTFRTTSPVVR